MSSAADFHWTKHPWSSLNLEGWLKKLRQKASIHKRSKIKFVIILQIYHEYYSWQKWIYSVLQEAVYYARLFACKRSCLRFTRSTFAFPSIISVVTKILKKHMNLIANYGMHQERNAMLQIQDRHESNTAVYKLNNF